MSGQVNEADRTDIALSLQGDEDAYARLVTRYQGVVASRMRRFARDRNDVEELVANVFVEAYLSLKSFRGRAPFLHWLRKIATRTGYRYWRERDRRKRLMDAVRENPMNLNDGDLRDPVEAADFLYKLFAKLDSKDRLVLTLIYLEELDTAEIAEQTGWTKTLVKVRAHRARKKLRDILEKENPGGMPI